MGPNSEQDREEWELTGKEQGREGRPVVGKQRGNIR